MNIYFAPLEGLTDAIFRRTHHACFSGINKYFIPFISPTQHLVLTPREYNSISPVQNAGMPVVPQVLTKNAEHFIWAANALFSEGYGEINLNIGCPSGTVTAKGKGAGMLRERDALRAFLDEIFDHSPISISIKTRIGYESPDEWPALMEIFAQYPVRELIIHARTREEFYKGATHPEVCAEAMATANYPVIYNGDLFTADDCRRVLAKYPGLSALMLGRGLISNPALGQELNGGAALTLNALRDFHDKLFDAYSMTWPKNAILGRMHEVMQYISCCFEDCARPRKALRKASSLSAYQQAVDWLFSDFRLRENPGFTSLK